MGFPWAAWLDAAAGGPVWPLLAAVAFRAGYYLLGVARLLAGYGPWRCGDAAEKLCSCGADAVAAVCDGEEAGCRFAPPVC